MEEEVGGAGCVWWCTFPERSGDVSKGSPYHLFGWGPRGTSKRRVSQCVIGPRMVSLLQCEHWRSWQRREQLRREQLRRACSEAAAHICASSLRQAIKRNSPPS